MVDFYTDIFSINNIVNHSMSKEEAIDKFYNLQGISLPKQTAHLVFNDALNRRFRDLEVYSEFKNKISSRYNIVESD